MIFRKSAMWVSAHLAQRLHFLGLVVWNYRRRGYFFWCVWKGSMTCKIM